MYYACLFVTILLVEPVLSFYRQDKIPLRRCKSTLSMIDDGDWLTIFDRLTTDIAKLGPIIPAAVAVFAFNLQEKSLGKDIKSSNDLLSKEIKATNEYIKSSNDLLSKDIKSSNDLLSKDIKATNEYIKSSNDLLSKDIKTVSNDISRLEKIVEKLLAHK